MVIDMIRARVVAIIVYDVMAERIRPSFYCSSTSSRFPGLLISDLVFTDTKLGRGADATVCQVEWNGTPCAAKRLHKILLEDESPGGMEKATSKKLLGNFEAECITWSKLRHPGVVQFLGVYQEPGSRVPVLVMEKMDTSLRKYLEDHSKEEFPLSLKTFVLHQITQALAYLHSQNPLLVHHDLSTNNVLLNMVSFVTKLTDFGMSRAINPSPITRARKSSIKGTPAFMAPEALQDPPQYNEKLDVFSFGNVILSTVTHEWPVPSHPTQYKGDQLIGFSEFQRREHYVEMFTEQEKQLFLPTVRCCLENRPDKRPSSVVLVQELRHIKSILPSCIHAAAPIEQLHQLLSAKEEECRQKDEVIREKDEALRVKDEVVRKKDATIEAQQHTIQDQQTFNQVQRTAIEKHQNTIQAQQVEIEHLKHQLIAAQKVSYNTFHMHTMATCGCFLCTCLYHCLHACIHIRPAQCQHDCHIYILEWEAYIYVYIPLPW